MFGDLNGVVCIPREVAEKVLEVIPDIVEADTRCALDIKHGVSFADVLTRYKRK